MNAHPAADPFSMMNPEGLAALAADIAEHGLQHPVVLEGEGRVLDGRNRLTACELAGVEPQFTEPSRRWLRAGAVDHPRSRGGDGVRLQECFELFALAVDLV